MYVVFGGGFCLPSHAAIFNPTKPSLIFFFFFSFTCVGYLFPPLQLVVCLCAWIWIFSEPPVREHVGGREFSSIQSTLCLLFGAFKVFPFTVIIDSGVLIALLQLDLSLLFAHSSSLCFFILALLVMSDSIV